MPQVRQKNKKQT